MATALTITPNELELFCRSHHIARLSLFGSRSQGTARGTSDVDLLAEFEPGAEPGLIGLAAMQDELGALLGLGVDLRTPAELSSHFRDEVLRHAQVQYAA